MSQFNPVKELSSQANTPIMRIIGVTHDTIIGISLPPSTGSRQRTPGFFQEQGL